MTKSVLVVFNLILTAFVVSAAQAQITVEVSKITCEEFASYKITDKKNRHMVEWILSRQTRQYIS
jgi:hypothetical protein